MALSTARSIGATPPVQIWFTGRTTPLRCRPGRREPTGTSATAGPRLSTKKECPHLSITACRLEALRGEHAHFSDIQLAADEEGPLNAIKGNRLEIQAVFEWESAEEFGLKVCCSPDGLEQTLIRFNLNPWSANRAPQKIGPLRELILDVSRSSINPEVSNRESQRRAFDLPYGEPLALRVFVDRSVVEVFANDLHYLAKRIYPAQPDSLGVQLFARGGAATVRSLDVWQMGAIWPIE